MTLNVFVLRECWWIFELCHYFPSSSFGRNLSKKQAKNYFLLTNKSMSVTVLYLTNGLLVWHYRFKFFLFLSLIADFMSSIYFVVKLSHYGQFQLKISFFGKKEKGWKNGVIYNNCFCWIVCAFGLRQCSLAKQIDFFLFMYVCLSLVIVRHIPDNDRSQLFPKDV